MKWNRVKLIVPSTKKQKNEVDKKAKNLRLLGTHSSRTWGLEHVKQKENRSKVYDCIYSLQTFIKAIVFAIFKGRKLANRLQSSLEPEVEGDGFNVALLVKNLFHNATATSYWQFHISFVNSNSQGTLINSNRKNDTSTLGAYLEIYHHPRIS